MRQTLLITSILFFSACKVYSCSCYNSWNDSFKLTSRTSEFVALIKVLSFDHYLDDDYYQEKIPYSMTVEIIEKYKGEESRKLVRIWGDNGILCRPYLTEFKINGYYLAAPIPIDNTLDTDYEFFVCRTDYLNVDFTKNKAYGNYSLIRKKIDITTFERKLEHGDWDVIILGLFVGLLTLILVIIHRNKKRMLTWYSQQ
jgi:hypothetical protein